MPSGWFRGLVTFVNVLQAETSLLNSAARQSPRSDRP
jgi:hypothetical protein